MTNKEIKAEADRLKKKGDDIKFFAETLEYDHQAGAKAELLAKAKDFYEVANGYYSLLPKHSALANER